MAATLNSDKVFIDPKEEISFVLERILNAEKQQVIMVAPQNSVIIANALSLKILFRHLLEAEKTVIIVTEDKFGTNIAQKSGFVVVKKVSQITSDLWEIAKGKQESYQIKKQQKKQSLLESRDGTKKEVVPVPVSEAHDVVDSFGEEHKDIVINETEAELFEEDDGFEMPEDKNKMFEGFGKSEEVKVKTVKGFEIVSGGDIEQLGKDEDNAKIDKLDINDDMAEQEPGNRKINESVLGQKRFAGRDLTKTVPQSSAGFFSRFFGGNKNPEDRLEEPKEKKPFHKRKSVWIGTGIFVFLLLMFYLVIFAWSSVNVEVDLKKEEVAFEESITGDLDAEEVDVETLTVPINEVEDSTSKSATADATGQSSRGERSTGIVYMINGLDEEVKLPRGTKITSLSSQLNFELTQDVTLPALNLTSDGTNDSLVDNIKVQAVTFGDEYNLKGSDSDTRFEVERYGANEIEVYRDDPFTGGTKEEFTSVSEENISRLEKKLIEELQDELEEDLNVPNGYKLLEGSIEFGEAETTSIPEIEQEAADGTFDLTVELSIKALIVKEDDLEEIISAALAGEDEIVVNDLSEITTDNFVRNEDDEIIFDILANSSITNKLEEDDIKDLINGRSVKNAERILEDEETINDASIKFNPALVPDFLKRVSGSFGRIRVEIN